MMFYSPSPLIGAAFWSYLVVTAAAVATTTTTSKPSVSKALRLRGNHVLEPAGNQPSSYVLRRLQGQALTTTRCNTIRAEDYQAELQLLYEYEVEFASRSSRSLAGMETLIAHAVAQELDACDSADRPLYKIKTSARHAFSKDRFCAPKSEGSTCNVVTGATAILLDSQSAHVQDEVYAAIKNGLNDSALLSQFAGTVVRARFVTGLHSTLVIDPNPNGSPATPPGSVTATVAVAAASVSFVVASIFCYGLLRREHRYHPEPHIRHKNRSIATRRSVETPMAMSKLSSNGSRRHFVRLEDVRLEDVASSPSMFAPVDYSRTPNTRDSMPSVAWSISDITSDCSSILSTLSRTTSSRLERIEEGENEGGGSHEEERSEYDDEGISMVDFRRRHFNIAMTVPQYFYGFDTAKGTKRSHVEDFDGGEILDNFEMETSDLEGCRYLDDNMEEQQESICHVVTDIEAEDDLDDFETEAMIAEFIGDLEASMETSRVDSDSIDISPDSDLVAGAIFCGLVSDGDDESIIESVLSKSDASTTSEGDGDGSVGKFEWFAPPPLGPGLARLEGTDTFDSNDGTEVSGHDVTAPNQELEIVISHSSSREEDSKGDFAAGGHHEVAETFAFTTPAKADGVEHNFDSEFDDGDSIERYGTPLQEKPQEEKHTFVDVMLNDEKSQACVTENMGGQQTLESLPGEGAAASPKSDVINHCPEDDVL